MVHASRPGHGRCHEVSCGSIAKVRGGKPKRSGRIPRRPVEVRNRAASHGYGLTLLWRGLPRLYSFSARSRGRLPAGTNEKLPFANRVILRMEAPKESLLHGLTKNEQSGRLDQHRKWTPTPAGPWKTSPRRSGWTLCGNANETVRETLARPGTIRGGCKVDSFRCPSAGPTQIRAGRSSVPAPRWQVRNRRSQDPVETRLRPIGPDATRSGWIVDKLRLRPGPECGGAVSARPSNRSLPLRRWTFRRTDRL